jgi:hypothetical protein
MKVSILICALFPLFSMAQSGNGGQSAENNFGKLEYVGYSNGEYVLNVTNKQTCTVNIKLEWLTEDSVISIAPNLPTIIRLPGAAVANTKIKSKPLDRCEPGSSDMGYLEIWTPISLPITFNYFRGTLISLSKMKLEFSVEDTDNEGKFTIQVSFDGRKWEDLIVILPFGSGVYTVFVEKAKKADGTTYFITSFK